MESKTELRRETLETTKELKEFEKHRSIIPYAVHHLQLRKLNELSPYLNIGLNNILSKICNRNEKTERKMQSIRALTEPKDFNKPQYKYPTTFLVTADIQYDIYHLFALGRNFVFFFLIIV